MKILLGNKLETMEQQLEDIHKASLCCNIIAENFG